MVTKELTVQSLTTKNAATLVKISSGFKSELWLILDGNKKVNAKSLMGIISLGLKAPAKLAVSADGTDEAAAADELVKFLISI